LNDKRKKYLKAKKAKKIIFKNRISGSAQGSTGRNESGFVLGRNETWSSKYRFYDYYDGVDFVNSESMENDANGGVLFYGGGAILGLTSSGLY
jgi:hypothetical protein